MMKMAVAIMLFLFSSAALADEEVVIWGKDLAWLSVKHTDGIHVRVRDQVTDGCWLSPGAAKSGVELEFVRSGLAIEEETESVWFQVSVVGFDVGGDYCAANISALAFAPELTERYNDRLSAVSLIRRVVWAENWLLTGDKASMSSRLNEATADLVKQFLVDTDKHYRAIAEAIDQEAPEEHRAAWRAYFAN